MVGGRNLADLLKDVFNKLWGKKISLFVFLALIVLGTIGQISPDWHELQLKDYIIIVTVYSVFIGYVVYVWRANRLPKAKTANRSILFVINAENSQLFDDVKRKLINEFCANLNKDDLATFEVKYINAEKLRKYNLDKKADVIKLLSKTNCAFLASVRYVVDSVTNIENCSIHVNCGIVHPTLTEKAQNLLQHDMTVLGNPIQKRKFKKSKVIDELEFTAHQLSIMCTYSIGLVEIFSGNIEDAYILFKKLYTTLGNEKKESIYNKVKSWYFICCVDNSHKYISLFQRDKHISALEKADAYLEEANNLQPNTYDYFLSKAYYYIAASRDIDNATRCIAECKKINSNQSWKYSDAFLIAFRECAASVIINKYKKALKVDINLLQIVDYIEYIIESDKCRIGLHLAAAMIYSHIPDAKLQDEHLALYFENENNPKNKDCVRRYFGK